MNLIYMDIIFHMNQSFLTQFRLVPFQVPPPPPNFCVLQGNVSPNLKKHVYFSEHGKSFNVCYLMTLLQVVAHDYKFECDHGCD